MLVGCSAPTAKSSPASSDSDVHGDDGDSSDEDGANDGSDADDADGPGFDECAGVKFDAEMGRRASNIVWVIDTSRSMTEEAAEVQDNINSFVQAILSAGLDDYRVVVVSEAQYVRVPDPL